MLYIKDRKVRNTKVKINKIQNLKNIYKLQSKKYNLEIQ